MRKSLLLPILALQMAACGGSSPTTPTPPPVTTTSTTTTTIPVIQTIQVTPCPTSGPPDLAFYQQIGCNGFELPAQPVRRWTKAPNVFIQTADIDSPTLDMIEATAREMVQRWTNNTLSVGQVERGAGTRQGQDGWLSVIWDSTLTSCGLSDVATNGGVVKFFPRGGTNCSCNGLAIRPRTVRHELGHALGYWHTDNPADLMSGQQVLGCDGQPSARELQAVAYHYR